MRGTALVLALTALVALTAVGCEKKHEIHTTQQQDIQSAPRMEMQPVPSGTGDQPVVTGEYRRSVDVVTDDDGNVKEMNVQEETKRTRVVDQGEVIVP